MRFRLLVAVWVASSGCADDVPTLEVMTTARTITTLAPPDDQIPMGLGHYRWQLMEAPTDSSELDPYQKVETATLTITPLTRGVYVFDRWFVGQAAEQLSYRVVVTAAGAPPTIVLTGPTTGLVGETVMYDGRSSTSPEERPLTFQWRLEARPEGSALELAGATNPTVQLVPDVAGDYLVELRANDGELWSQPATATLTAY